MRRWGNDRAAGWRVVFAPAVSQLLPALPESTQESLYRRMEELAEPYIRRRALRHLEKGRVVIFAAGTGNPYFSTDTAAVLRAIEMDADLLVKATKVEGVYTADPHKDPTAKFIPRLSFQEVLSQELGVMDAAAFSLCKDNGLPIVVLNVQKHGAMIAALRGEEVGTLVS